MCYYESYDYERYETILSDLTLCISPLREPGGQLGQFGYTSVERLLPPYPSYSRSAHYHR